ncbi:MAG TPA: bifunctional precorrin-2 dehydrogenase/sirohydrochlorin ferrochelatase [Labilithrix sp.]|nr:bifunctional precorrin-2 dehydrogenase/sirohydrochlorin ferrochelatase [Labilithrix sp.]
MSDPSLPRVLLPLFLDVTGRAVLVVGAGTIASRKALDLVAAGANVHVVAPAISAELTEAASDALTLEQRPFEERDLDGAWLVFAATDDAAVQRRVAGACERARVFCVAVDDPPNASAYGGAVVRRGPVTIAISTSGEAPAVARLLREILEQLLPDEGYLEAARALRERWRSEKTPMGSRFAELVAAFKARA